MIIKTQPVISTMEKQVDKAEYHINGNAGNPHHNGGLINGQYQQPPVAVNGQQPAPGMMMMTQYNNQGVAPSLGRTVTGYDGERWMMSPVDQGVTPTNCPPGLEYLTMIDQLLVKQRVEVRDVTGTRNL